MNAETDSGISRSDVEFPIKRTRGDTLEESMTSNAYNNILPSRYLRRDNDGNIVEDKEEVFERVGKNIALAEVVYLDEEFEVDSNALKDYTSETLQMKTEEEVFGESDGVVLTEENIKYFGFDNVREQLPQWAREEMDKWADEFTELMEELSFIPNSPTIMNAGDDLQQLSACFVNSPDDDMDDIHETIREAAKTFQSGGGLGYSFSDLRPYGDKISTTGGISSGPLTFMSTFDAMCETVAQGGKRRGAQMGVMRIDHPDIPFFIHAKNKDVSLAKSLRLNDPDDYTHSSFGEALEEARDLIEDERVPPHLRNAAEGHLSNFNISTTITDEFMNAVDNDEEYDLINPRTGEPHVATEETKELWSWFGLAEHIEVGEEMSVPAREIWEHIIDGAYENGEPGVVYIDRVNDDHSFDVEKHEEYRIESTNPCLPGDTEVLLENGSTVTMRELAEREDLSELDVVSMSGTTVTPANLLDAFKTREGAEVYTISADGLSVRATADHRVRTTNGWKEVQDLDETGPDKDVLVCVTQDGERTERTLDSVELSGTEDVYDLKVETTSNFCAFDSGSTLSLNVHNCGEQPLMQYEACNLGHINLSTVVSQDGETNFSSWAEEESTFDLSGSQSLGSRGVGQEDSTELEENVSLFLEQALDTEELHRRIRLGTRFLENVVTMSNFPTEDFERVVSNNRKVGLGIMGLAQMYIQLGVEYGSEVGNEIARQVMERINHLSKLTSHKIAEDRGVFENWDDSKYANPTEYPDWFKRQTGEDPERWENGFKIRNHNTTTIAPTGTTSMLGNTTGGCEPMYNVAYYKNVSEDVQGDEMLVEFDDYFLRILEENDIDVEEVKQEAESLMEQNEFDGVESLSTVPDAIGEVITTTSDLSGREHAAVQTACQHGVDSAISKTCNFPNDATRDDMEEAYWEVYNNGGKGVTVYRDGTRSKQVLTTRAENQDQEVDEDTALEVVNDKLDSGELTQKDLNLQIEPEERGKSLSGTTQKVNTARGNMYVTVNEGDTGMLEVFTTIGKSGSYTESYVEAISRLISLSLRSGVSADAVISELEQIRGPEVKWDDGDRIHSVPDGIATAMQRHQAESNQTEAQSTDTQRTETQEQATQQTSSSGEQGQPECPDCGSINLEYSEGCKKCSECGWSAC